MPILTVSNLHKTYDSVHAVDDVSFSADSGELLCLLGPSGCGKSTMLRLLAGLDEPDSGTMTFEGRNLNGLATQERGFGLMFQDLALFPHMDVFGNVAFGLRMQKLPSAEVSVKVHELLDLVEMRSYAHRRVHELSGGERQRVALARSLAPAPKLLMLDEPLSSLDRVLREGLQSQVRRILKEIGVTSIYVTHDRDEAFTMADRLIFMNQGQIIQTGTPEEAIANPADGFVASTLGFKNVLKATISKSGDYLKVKSPIGTIIAAQAEDLPVYPSYESIFLIPEDGILVSGAESSNKSPENSFQGLITERVFRGNRYELRVLIGDGELYCHTSASATNKVGGHVTLTVDPNSIQFLSCLLYTSPSPRDGLLSRMPSSA